MIYTSAWTRLEQMKEKKFCCTYAKTKYALVKLDLPPIWGIYADTQSFQKELSRKQKPKKDLKIKMINKKEENRLAWGREVIANYRHVLARMILGKKLYEEAKRQLSKEQIKQKKLPNIKTFKL
jgi:hypothetical protein